MSDAKKTVTVHSMLTGEPCELPVDARIAPYCGGSMAAYMWIRETPEQVWALQAAAKAALLDSERNELQEELAELQKCFDRVTDQRDEVRKKLREQSAVIDEQQAKIAELSERVALNPARSRSRLSEKLETLQEKLAKAEEEANQERNGASIFAAMLDELKAKNEELQRKLDDSWRDLNAKQLEISKYEMVVKNLNKSNADNSGNQWRSMFEENEKTIVDLRKQRNDLERVNNELSVNLSKANVKIIELSALIAPVGNPAKMWLTSVRSNEPLPGLDPCLFRSVGPFNDGSRIVCINLDGDALNWGVKESPEAVLVEYRRAMGWQKGNA